MQVASVTQSEVRLVIEAAFELANAVSAGDADVRAQLTSAGFSRASNASAASIHRLEERIEGLLPLLEALPDGSVRSATAGLNEELTEIAIAPSITEHDDVGPHIHWTAGTATFDDQVIADVLMALVHEVCDNGTERFGRCAADDCDRLFYDGTRNRSKRFCSDSRCASRTHVARHRARKRDNVSS